MFGKNEAATVKSQPLVGQSLLEKGKTLQQILQKENPGCEDEINKKGGGRSVVALGYVADKGVKSMVCRELWNKAALDRRMLNPKKKKNGKRIHITTNNAIEDKGLGRSHCGLQVPEVGL